ncbi:tyrosine-type recombinase/integrase [Paenibacillus chibensis]|uniref:tyrosine-type recombinase/integrase n=1 Tax=Paenibacillus chibensis TaxID=59846 RepID=UPI000FD84BA4|nr:tyrosine-type recombinase/integrase [Paenibacillus chibensis]MEC0369991.1 tyrosine-type recombinase/integrase [Paenibacillus chibensis]
MARVRSINTRAGERPHWREVLTEFIDHKRIKDGISGQTISDYERTVSLLMKRFPNAWDSDDDLKESVFAHLSEEIAPATFNNRLVYTRAFISWCVETGYLSNNPLSGMKKRKTENRAVSIEVDVLSALLNAPDQSTFVGLRDYTLILLTLDTGIRPSEATRLIPQDFNASAREMYVPSKVAKGRVARTLPLSDITVKSIRKLIAVRSEDWSEETPIFCSYEGRPLNRHTWGDRMEIYSNQIGRHIRPYDLRHVFALEFLRNGANAFSAQKALGHSTMEMTRKYIALVNNDLKMEHQKASPLNTVLNSKVKRNTKI